jgi:hypothetical protein
MRDCCVREAKRSLSEPRDVATCDECGSLLLAYGDPRDFESAVEELTRHGVSFESEPAGPELELAVIAKARKRS